MTINPYITMVAENDIEPMIMDDEKVAKSKNLVVDEKAFESPSKVSCPRVNSTLVVMSLTDYQLN